MYIYRQYMDVDNMEYKLYRNDAGHYCVRIFDTDSKNVVGIKVFPNLHVAKVYYNRITKKPDMTRT